MQVYSNAQNRGSLGFDNPHELTKEGKRGGRGIETVTRVVFLLALLGVVSVLGSRRRGWDGGKRLDSGTRHCIC